MRARLAIGEKPLDWIGSSKRDFLAFPAEVQREIGNALGLAQFGGTHPNAKPWKGEGPGVFEVVDDFDGDTTGRFTRCAFSMSSMCCTRSRKNRRAGKRPRASISNSLRAG